VTAFYITGGNSGLGKGMVNAVPEVHEVHILSREGKITSYNFLDLDLSKVDKVSEFKFIFDSKITNAIFINNASVLGEINKFGSLSSQSIIETFNINLISPMVLINSFIKCVNSSGISGLVVNITSGLINYPMSNLTSYIGSKLSLHNVTTLILQESIKKIKMFSIDPGLLDTSMQKTLRNSHTLGSNNYFQKKYKENKLKSPIDTGKKIVDFILSEKWENGQNYHINML